MISCKKFVMMMVDLKLMLLICIIS